MQEKIKENFSIITAIYGLLSLIAFFMTYSFSQQGYSLVVILLPLYFGIVFLVGGARNIIKKPEREVVWEKFLREVWMEIVPPHGKVTWPDRKTVFGSTVIVLVTVLLVSIYIGILDIIFRESMEFISKWMRGVLG